MKTKLASGNAKTERKGILDDFRKAKAEPDYDTSIGINYWYIVYFVIYFQNKFIYCLYIALKLLLPVQITSEEEGVFNFAMQDHIGSLD
ncbi:hypothetical protein [Sphingobacterium athyrii]|uniref:Uncharacterized protein n=1 Tax=Sphingobacterium athyrii TaxID=2152717 RepID=A0A363NXI2_9SPHI|nr:hypothetical protein [Sphingobacterium athyrii]PUV25433.1 hypothetical protein DCO56_00065 [Sphingobacterium athyrii]